MNDKSDFPSSLARTEKISPAGNRCLSAEVERRRSTARRRNRSPDQYQELLQKARFRYEVGLFYFIAMCSKQRKQVLKEPLDFLLLPVVYMTNLFLI